MPAWARYAKALSSIAQAVGNTPLVRLNRVTRGVTPPVYVKVEWYGATGSLKDRIYLHMFERAEARGDLKPGMRVLECSTGNAGIACAWVSAVKGYPCTIVMPQGMSEERKKIMRAYGTTLVFTPGGESDVDLSLARLGEIRAAEPGRYWVPGQFENPDNVEAHTLSTGPELWSRWAARPARSARSWTRRVGWPHHRGGPLSPWQGPGVRLYAVEPAEVRPARATRVGPSRHRGHRRRVRAAESRRVAPHRGRHDDDGGEHRDRRRLAARKASSAGSPADATVAAALKLARAHPELPSIITIINDTGQRYFTTALCGETKHVDIPEREHLMDAYTTGELDRYQKGWEDPHLASLLPAVNRC
jgi:cysteine synthase A